MSAYYLAADVYNALIANGCTFEGDAFSAGAGWISSSGQVFMLPVPIRRFRNHWFDADVIDTLLADRWLGFRLNLTRYSPGRA